MMLPRNCPSAEALAQAISAGSPGALQGHLQSCAACRAEWEDTQALIALGRKLPSAPPPEGERHAELRARLLSAAAGLSRPRVQRPTRRWPLLAAAGMLILLGAGLRGLWPPRATSPEPARPAVAARHGVVRALGDARFLHLGDARDEIVRLAEGTVLIEVSPLQPHHRFRVLTADGEVEVRGTVFEVSARGDVLRGVRVVNGRVVVRAPHAPEQVLHPGQRWAAPEAVSAPPLPMTPPVPPSKAPRPSKAGAPGVAAPLAAERRESAFEEGWAALRAGQYGPAAEAFHHAETVAVSPVEQEDAAYWRVVALARAGRKDDAAVGMRAFLRLHERSRRVGEVAAMLGWILLDQGELEEAERRFRGALPSDNAAAQRSAAQGLRAIEALRKR